ncbi:sensor histidine kinase [Nakamurella leprariae]|uniref:sensor histidine kinase n=1 Tax=Nakamurella leprariae TaxID=2803911 RepID=UPI002E28E95C|nr:HAMP domain-containing sensor histidine kinase [Nakamurella leprariae]
MTTAAEREPVAVIGFRPARWWDRPLRAVVHAVGPSGPSLRARLTGLSTALLALIGALLLALAYLLVGQVVAALPQFPPGTLVQVEGQVVESTQAAAMLVDEGRRSLLLVGSIAFPALVVVGAVMAWVLIGRALRPLSELTRTSQELSESSLDRRIRLAGPRDEVAVLADTFDEMLDRLQAAFEAERRFVANASHELRTPLAVIRTEIDVTLADPGADATVLREMAEVVREATDSADRLLSSLLLLARTQARGLRRVADADLALLVPAAVRAVDGEIRDRDVQVELQLDPAAVSGDPELLQRLVGNLVENAVRHNVPGGWLRVVTGRGAGPASGTASATASGTASGTNGSSVGAELVVASSGPEVPPETVTQLFEPFRQGGRARTGHGGSGLGLSIVQAVVGAHGGTVVAAATPGGGLTVTVTLPPEPPRRAEGAAPDPGAAAGSTAGALLG